MCVCTHARTHTSMSRTGVNIAHLVLLLDSSRVKDIHDTLDITVYSGDGSKGSEFVGMMTIPLLRVSNLRTNVCKRLYVCPHIMPVTS